MSFVELEQLLGKDHACECGRRHSVPTRHVIYSEDAADELARRLRAACGGAVVLVLADARTWEIAGREVAQACGVAGWLAREYIVPDGARGTPVCDDVTFTSLQAEVPAADVYIAAGSGVINDLTKWLAHARGAQYGVMATAASMNGYAAANVAPTVRGVKILERAQAPVVVAARPSVLAAAPWRLTAAGLGDVLAKPVSVADWRLNHELVNEHFCARCAELITQLEPLYAERPAALRAGDATALSALFHALVYSGVAMTMMGNSAPASGGEHLFSHTLDMLDAVDGGGHDLHGRQVGIGTILAAELHRRVWKIEDVEPVIPPREIDARWWGELAPAVAAQYAAKQDVVARIAAAMRDKPRWDAVRRMMNAAVPAPEKIVGVLKAAGAAHRLRDINVARARAREVVLHMHEMRARTTIVDLAWLAGVLPQAADELLDLVD